MMKVAANWWRKIRQHPFYLSILILFVAFLLRVWGLGQVPPSVYWDEMALAYDGWSLATTARDMHGNFLPASALVSFGDYKPSGYFYAVALVMMVIGPQLLAVKVPSLLASVMIVWLAGRLAGKVFPELKNKYWWWENLVMLLVAINPSFIHLGHVGFETVLATAFFLGGVYLLYPSADRKTEKSEKKFMPKFDWPAVGGEVCLLLSFYTYHSLRVIAPLAGIYLLWWRWHKLAREAPQRWRKIWRSLGVMSILAMVALTPFVLDSKRSLTNRFSETSIFSDVEIIKQSNQCRQLGGEGLLARWWCHRYWFFARQILQNFGDHFTWDYLFFHGDVNRRHSVGLFGVLYPVEMIALFLGVVYLSKNWRRRQERLAWLLFWLVIAVLPASFTRATPHLLRTLTLLPLLLMVVAAGWVEVMNLVGKRWRPWLVMVVTLIYVGMLAAWLYYYHVYYPRAFAGDWQDGYEAAYRELAAWQEKYPQLPVYVTRELGRPAVYYFWYRQIAPASLQAIAGEQGYDQAEYITYTPDKIKFGPGWEEKEQLFVLTMAESTQLTATPEAAVIEDVGGKPVLAVGHWVPLESSHE